MGVLAMKGLNIVSKHKNYFYVSKLLEINSCYPKQFKTCIQIVNLERTSGYFGYLFQLYFADIDFKQKLPAGYIKTSDVGQQCY